MASDAGEGAESKDMSHTYHAEDHVDLDKMLGPVDDNNDIEMEEESPLAATEEALVNDEASHAAVSQPMTASNSTSSNPSTKDVAPAPKSSYGTRSRNRGGASRPNYAEDKELDHEFEERTPPKAEENRKVVQPQPTTAVNSAAPAPPPVARRGPALVEHQAPSQTMAKDYIPGTSSFSVHPSPVGSIAPSKKRKAVNPAVPVASVPLNAPVARASAGQLPVRRGSISTQVMNGWRETCMLTFDNCAAKLKDRQLIADDGTVLRVNDHVYMVCEPPGEPYYLGRIMEFLHVDNNSKNAVEALRMNWYYRAKDIGRRSSDTRQVFASMHQDISPLTALRGPCQILHRSEITHMEGYRSQQNCFWYEKLYDRYIHRYYEVIPTSIVVNVPAKVKRVLDERWRFILVESGRGKELTSAVKSCKRCSGYCASNDSVDCAVCKQTYHMNCVRPPLLKKPSRGFAWACGPCSRAQERKLAERSTPNILHDVDEEEVVEEEEEVCGSGLSSPSDSVIGDLATQPGTAEQIYQASLWPFRYLGIHCRVEDALDYDDRIYPRASSRLGARHQAEVAAWPGRPFELVRPIEVKRKYTKGGAPKKESKLSKDTLAALDSDKVAREKRPKWVVDGPIDYIPRGEDLDNDDPNNTATLLFRPAEDDKNEIHEGVSYHKDQGRPMDVYERYMVEARPLAGGPNLNIHHTNTEFWDKAINILWANNYNIDEALKQLATVKQEDLKRPNLTAGELKKFEDGVAKFGSELHSVKKHVKTLSAADVVRFYYVWKKSPRGEQIWGNFKGRKGKKEAKKVDPTAPAGKLQDDVAHDHDDSAFDCGKAWHLKRGFQCKFCSTRSSRQWRRAPGTAAGTTVPVNPGVKTSAKDKSAHLMVALCINCAIVWRKYAVQWDENDDFLKKAAAGGRAAKRKADDPLREFQLNEMNLIPHIPDLEITSHAGTPTPQIPSVSTQPVQEPARKKLKSDKDQPQAQAQTDPIALDSGGVVTAGKEKKKATEKQIVKPAVVAPPLPPPPPPVPEIPKPRVLPCAVCHQMDPSTPDQLLVCKECRLHVHRNCYGVVNDTRGKWTCDMCINDRNPHVSTQYQCVLCPVHFTYADFVEPPKMTHRKKNEKDRERERVERESAIKAADHYRRKQEELNKPLDPREVLKRTANNNWVHVTCAVWTPEVKFGNAASLQPSEGIGMIPLAKYDDLCKLCNTNAGACIPCHQCKATVHIGCAHAFGYTLGFDITPVKSSRKDVISTVNINGETGYMTATVWCKEHLPTKSIIHKMHDVVDDTGRNALQLFVQTYKQADLTLTGTIRKANMVHQSTKAAAPVTTSAIPSAVNRRASTTANNARGLVSAIKVEDTANRTSGEALAGISAANDAHQCVTCEVDTSPRWWVYPAASIDPEATINENSNRTVTVAQSIEKESEPPLTNGESAASIVVNVPEHVALASAALKEETTVRDETQEIEFQCHKCHYQKIRKRVPSPTPVAPVQPPTPAAQIPLPTSLASPAPLASPSLAQAPAAPQLYGWPPQQQSTVYSPGFWARPSPGPTASPVHHFSRAQSPHTVPAAILGGLGTQAPPPRSSTILAHSSLPNGINQPSLNGYPQSQHRPVNGSHSMTSGSSYLSYSATMPSPHHLTNGGPPLRASDHPFVNHNPIHRHSPYGPPPPLQSNPSMLQDPASNRNGASQPPSGPRPGENRVNGGASASPSLHNLLS